jgi:hypothetical protein
MNLLMPLTIVLLSAGALVAEPSADDIIKRSVAATKANWQEAPSYSFINRDAERKRSSSTIKTYEVLMIEGSPYNKLIAVDDRPLMAGEQAEENRRLERETLKSQHESNRERTRRIAKYRKEREQDQALMKEMAVAFHYTLAGEDHINGRQVWVLDATPKPGYVPLTHETKVLTGMKGELWVDKATYQWVKVEAQVVKPVSFFGFVARVGPGTKFELEQAPVADNVWLPTHFSVKVNATAFGFISENSTEDDTYRDYHLMPNAVANAQGTR